MKQKVQRFLSMVLAAALACGSMAAVPAMAEETLIVEDSLGNEEEVILEEEEEILDDEEEIAEEEEETETETEESDFIEGSAVLSDYDYEAGEMDEDGWESEFLNLKYEIPEDSGIYMGIDENEQLKEYTERNGEDKQVSINEMVAMDEDGGYVQLMVEVNPNHESADDILERFTENEELELLSVSRDFDIADRTFVARTGVNDSEKYMIGVCTEEDGLVIAVKVKYENTTARKELLSGFAPIEEDEEESESESESESETEDLFIIEDETEEDAEEAETAAEEE